MQELSQRRPFSPLGRVVLYFVFVFYRVCERRAFFRLRAILSEFAVGYFTRSTSAWSHWPRRWGRRENCSRRLNWMAAINSGQSAAIGSSSSRAMHIFHTRRQYSYLSTVIARYLPAGDLSLRKESQIFNSLTFMATTEEEWGPDLNSSNCSTILKNQDSSFVQRKAKYFRRFLGSIWRKRKDQN